jgi:hypothetical protein
VLFQDRLGGFGIIPEIGIFLSFVELFQAGGLGRQVKDNL